MSDAVLHAAPRPVAEATPVDPRSAIALLLGGRWNGARQVASWTRKRSRVSALLREAAAPGPDWAQRLQATNRNLLAMVAYDLDAALFLLMQAGASELDQYAAHHAMLCAVVCDACGRWLDASPEELGALGRAALTMNIGMAGSQDALARQVTPLTADQRRAIAAHGEAGADLLRAAGVDDPLWLEVVRLHNLDELPGDASAPARRLVPLLRRADVYTAKLSSRATRQAMSPAIAARDACLNAQGRPDAIGATMLRCMGLYPPGTFVQLKNGDVAVVVRRGAKAHAPAVVPLRRADGGTFPQADRVDTADPRHAVVRGLSAAEAKVRVDQPRVLAAKGAPPVA